MTKLPFDLLVDLEAKEPLGESGTSVAHDLPLRETGPGLIWARGGVREDKELQREALQASLFLLPNPNITSRVKAAWRLPASP